MSLLWMVTRILYLEKINEKVNNKVLQHNMSEITKLDQNLILKKIDNETVNIQINNNEILMSIVGQFDQNLKDLSKLTKTEIFFRGNSITCKGKKKI